MYRMLIHMFNHYYVGFNFVHQPILKIQSHTWQEVEAAGTNRWDCLSLESEWLKVETFPEELSLILCSTCLIYRLSTGILQWEDLEVAIRHQIYLWLLRGVAVSSLWTFFFLTFLELQVYSGNVHDCGVFMWKVESTVYTTCMSYIMMIHTEPCEQVNRVWWPIQPVPDVVLDE